MSAQISSDQAQQRTLLIQPSRQCVQRTTELVLRKNIEYCGLDGAFLTHCWLRWLRGVLLQWNDPKHTRNHRIRPVENQDSSILFNVLQVHGRTLASAACLEGPPGSPVTPSAGALGTRYSPRPLIRERHALRHQLGRVSR